MARDFRCALRDPALLLAFVVNARSCFCLYTHHSRRLSQHQGPAFKIAFYPWSSGRRFVSWCCLLCLLWFVPAHFFAVFANFPQLPMLFNFAYRPESDMPLQPPSAMPISALDVPGASLCVFLCRLSRVASAKKEQKKKKTAPEEGGTRTRLSRSVVWPADSHYGAVF